MITTYGVKYLGSKKTLNEHIIATIQNRCPDVKTAIDVFTGTTRVAQALRQKDIKVTTSDLSWASEAYAYAFVHNHDNTHLRKRIDELNALEPEPDWLTEHYCDVQSKDGKGGLIRVWQPKNGAKADAIRNKIETYSDLKPWEKMTLITSLIFALDAVDNTVGVQQAYLKEWCKRSSNDLHLKLPPMLWAPMFTQKKLPVGRHIVGDALKIKYPKTDLAYLDPPYSSHSYATYYHIWDSIVKWDKIDVDLKTNRRADRVAGHESYDNTFDSPWNRKSLALEATERLIQRLPVKYVLFSYNNESLIPQDDLISLCQSVGEIEIKRIDYKRNIMHKIGCLSEETEIRGHNQELLILVRK